MAPLILPSEIEAGEWSALPSRKRARDECKTEGCVGPGAGMEL